MRHFCTYFDKNYFARGLTLYRSLRKQCPAFRLYALSLDNETFTALRQLALPDLVPISLPEVEAWAPDLTVARSNRSTIEYYFTLSPALPLFILELYPAVDIITYVDADIFFYADPETIFTELGDRSILVTEHRFPPRLQYMAQKGRFNVQFQSFRRNPQGLACLQRWHRQCIDWCYDRVSDGKYADQKYLDEWPDRYDDLCILTNKGCALGPWNWTSADLRLEKNRAFAGDAPVVFYHFHGMKILHRRLISLGMYRYGKMPANLRRWFYGRYAAELKQAAASLKAAGINLPGFTYRDIRSKHSFVRAAVESLLSRQLMIIQ